MTSTRWRKVFTDLWGNKTRTILTILTITVGVFAVGFIAGMRGTIVPDTEATYMAANPHSAMLYTMPFSDDMLDEALKVPGVTEVDGRSYIVVRLIANEDRKLDLNIDSVTSISEMGISVLQPVEPLDLPPLQDDEIWIESSAVGLYPVEIGDTIEVQLPDGEVRELHVVGIVRDASVPAAMYNSALSAYANPATVEALGGPVDFNRMLLVIDDHTRDEDQVNDVVEAVSERLRDHDVMVFGTWIYNPGEHYSSEINGGVMMVMDVLGGITVLLSTFLVINTINSH